MDSEVFLYITGSVCLAALCLLLYCTCCDSSVKNKEIQANAENLHNVQVVDATPISNVVYGTPVSSGKGIEFVEDVENLASVAETYLTTVDAIRKEQQEWTKILQDAQKRMYDVISKEMNNSGYPANSENLPHNEQLKTLEKVRRGPTGEHNAQRGKHKNSKRSNKSRAKRAMSMPSVKASQFELRETEINQGLERNKHYTKHSDFQSFIYSDNDSQSSNDGVLSYVDPPSKQYNTRSTVQTCTSTNRFIQNAGPETVANFQLVNDQRNRQHLQHLAYSFD